MAELRYNTLVKYIITALSLLSIFLSSCSTMNNRQTVLAAGDISADLVSGDAEALSLQSGTPFLFETEILPAPAQLDALWQGLAASGYDFGPSGEIIVLDPDDDSWQRFSSSREVEVWFQRHAPSKAALVVIPTSSGHLVLIIDRDRRDRKPLRGLKVETE